MSNSIRKEIVDYYDEEWIMQKELIHELILRNGNVDVNENDEVVQGAYYLYTIEDVRNYIQKLASKEKKSLTFDVDINKNLEVNMKLNSEESIIMNLKGNIRTEKVQKKTYLATDYILHLNIQSLKENK